MNTGSYLELALTVYGWHVSNRLAELIVASGLIYLPLLFLVWRNWSQPVRSQEARAAAPVSMRRMEQDVAIVFVTIAFAFLPLVEVTPADVKFVSESEQVVEGTSPELPYKVTDHSSIKVPALWWLVHQASSGFSTIFAIALRSFNAPSNARSISLALDYAKLDDPRLVAELRQFDSFCYLPARAKWEQAPAGSPVTRRGSLNTDPRLGHANPEWRGDELLFSTPGYYDDLQALEQIPEWTDIYDWNANNVGPKCDEWWNHPSKGLLERIYQTLPQNVHQRITRWRPQVPSQDKKNAIVRKHLTKVPPPNVATGQTHDPERNSRFGDVIWDRLGGIGALISYPFVRAAMGLVVTGLPMIQAIVLMCVYIAIPIAVPFAPLKPGLIVFFVVAIFTLKFMTGLWALASFIDTSITSFMYRDDADSVLVGSGDASDLVLAIITSLTYMGLPLVWLWLMSSFTGRSIDGVNSLFSNSAGKLESASQRGVDLTKGALTKGASDLISKKS